MLCNVAEGLGGHIEFTLAHCCSLTNSRAKEEETDFTRRSKVHCTGDHKPFGNLSQLGLNPTKLVYDPDQPDG